MKLFAASLIASYAAAQYFDSTEPWPQMEVNVTEVETAMEDVKSDMFVLNDEGRLEFQDSLKDLPSLSFTDVDEQVIMDWIKGNESDRNEIASQWNTIWAHFVDAIQEPSREFLDNAEDLDKADATLDLKTSLDISNFVAENVFVDGTSLDEMFPQIDSALAEYEAWAQGEIDTIEYGFGDNHNTLKRRRRPKQPVVVDVSLKRRRRPAANVNLKRRNRKVKPVVAQSDYGYYYDYDSEYYYDSYDSEPTFMEKAAEKISEIAKANGYDQAEVDDWLSTKESAWNDLGERQDREAMEMLQQDTQEASQYVKSIIDSMISEIRAKESEMNEELTQAITDKLSDAKAEIDAFSQEQMDQAQQLADEAGEAAQSFNPPHALQREIDYEELKELAMSFKSRSELSASSNHTQYGYGVLAIGAALATAAFFAKKRQQKAATFVNESEPLNKSQGDSAFQMV